MKKGVLLLIFIFLVYGAMAETDFSPQFNITVTVVDQIPNAEPPVIIGNNPGGKGGGGGGGGGGIDQKNVIENLFYKGDFSVDKEKMIIALKQGEAKRDKIVLENIGENDIEISVNNLELGDFIRNGDRKFILGAGEKTFVLMDFLAKEDKKADVYTGKIIISSGNIKKEVIVSIEVEQREPLLDVKIEIQKEYLNVKRGGEIIAKINIINLDKIGNIDAEIEYGVKDSNNNVIYKESELINFKESREYEKKFILPKDVNIGDYVLYINAIYDGKAANSSAFFKVVRYFYIVLIIAILGLISLFLVFLKFRTDGQRKIAADLMKNKSENL